MQHRALLIMGYLLEPSCWRPVTKPVDAQICMDAIRNKDAPAGAHPSKVLFL
jgi:hypothetical protein